MCTVRVDNLVCAQFIPYKKGITFHYANGKDKSFVSPFDC